MTTKVSWFDKVKTDFLVDVAIFIAFLVAMDPHSTGISIHEWLSIALGAAVVAHLVLHWHWIVAITRRIFGDAPRQARWNYVLNVLLFIDMTMIMLSGLLISEAVLPALGIALQPEFAWRALHSLSADLALLLLGLHLALHWRWIVATARRYLLAPLGRLIPTRRPVAQPVPQPVNDKAVRQ